MSVLPSLEEKSTYVKHMFARIAPNYDRVNHLMTFGQDLFWREYTVQAVAPPINGRALDIGTGTGDLLPLLAKWMPDGIAVGVDFCLPMMQAGQHKLDQIPVIASSVTPTLSGKTAFIDGDVLQLPFPDNSFDTITTGFVMRNVTHIQAAFQEMWRITRPGGCVACLEVARPRNMILRYGHQLYFEVIVPWIGWLISADRQAYTYLPQSARAFPSPPELATIMRAVGWNSVSYTLLSFGAVAVHIGIKY